MTQYEEASSLFVPHPAYGRYRSHHPSRRIVLMMRAGVAYSIAVIVLQLLTWNVSDNVAAVFLPISYGGIAAAALWYVVHYWNREVVLYERGFTYREGSRTGQFYYKDITTVRQNIEDLSLGSLRLRTIYTYQMISRYDEQLTINNIYSETRNLINRLDSFIARERLPELREDLAQSKPIRFGDAFQLSQAGIGYEGKILAWDDVVSVRVRGGSLIIDSVSEEVWAVESVPDIDNVVIFIGLIKALAPRIEQSQQSTEEQEVSA